MMEVGPHSPRPVIQTRRRRMKRLAPALMVLALAAGCAKDSFDDKPIDPRLHVATVEVDGMH